MKVIHILGLGMPAFWHMDGVGGGKMGELLGTLQVAWLLGGVAVGIWHEWWRKRVPHAGEAAWRSRIGEELVYIWFGGIVLVGLIRWLLGDGPPPDPSDNYPD